MYYCKVCGKNFTLKWIWYAATDGFLRFFGRQMLNVDDVCGMDCWYEFTGNPDLR